jgi:nucleotide-binding universal stress UspA family protein
MSNLREGGMIRSILLPAADGAQWVTAREYAFWLARESGSRIHALALIDVKSYEMPVLGTADGFMPSVVAPPLDESRALLDELTAAARERIADLERDCSSHGLSVSSDIKTGIPGEIVCREAVAHDIVVMSRGGYDRASTEQRIDPLVQSVIRGSIRPVLVAGQRFREIGHVLVAYDGSVHASRSLAVAAELGSRPGVRTTLVNIAQSEEIGQETLLQAEGYLYHHGLSPQKKVVIGSKPSDLICDLVSATGADLLVMGAYGHRAIREMLFGSTTERVLSHCGSSVVLQS